MIKICIDPTSLSTIYLKSTSFKKILSMKLYNITFLRKIVLPILKKLSRDIEINHHWINRKTISLNSFKHKGYWYHGKKREEKSMILFSKIIKPNSNVIEVGGHIGYISLFFEKLNEPSGNLYTF